MDDIDGIQVLDHVMKKNQIIQKVILITGLCHDVFSKRSHGKREPLIFIAKTLSA